MYERVCMGEGVEGRQGNKWVDVTEKNGCCWHETMKRFIHKPTTCKKEKSKAMVVATVKMIMTIKNKKAHNYDYDCTLLVYMGQGKYQRCSIETH